MGLLPPSPSQGFLLRIARVWILLCILCTESAEAFPKVLYLYLGHSWFNWNQDVLEDMIFTNLIWGLSYVHLQLGAKIVIRCMSEDSCKDFLSFWKVGLLLDIIVLPFLFCLWDCVYFGSWIWTQLKSCTFNQGQGYPWHTGSHWGQ